METKLQSLTEMSTEIKTLEKKLSRKREKRNRLALELVKDGRHSLRKVAEHAGIRNSYLVELRKKLNGS